ncbi:zinc transport system substrate-binding protein [Litoreibacter ascidiaceicola]|uniref:High-affinity zinc uptake system protein ZnuA n=1 Tax=Litoreibacter ascidiaceicola TaxID=1486859 RepID=A0A1M4ZIT7_9RHOB|nr:zinc ABC transporter substrate-binding protein [Litoreibacter ascidiaceicola]SHF17944.1 zinc transport system substrate-binding protein [Litoreibacter ascidiaceicola]
MLRPALASLLLSLPQVALAETPRVVTDIAPIHSLVAQVMGDLGTPELLVTANASPHSFSLRPSQAGALEQAQAVFWVGDGLTPWLEPLLDRLAPNAKNIEFLHRSETETLAFRTDAAFEADGHDHGDHDGHDDHDDHSDVDPHAWLNPDNAAAWLAIIASELSVLDPENADTYAANAQRAEADLHASTVEIERILAPAKGKTFIVFHDAFHYFEARFDVEASAAISLGDATAPGPARVERIQELVREKGVSCAFSEPQFSEGLVATVLDGTDARVAVLDPLGSTLPIGPSLYTEMLLGMAKAIAGC